MEKITKKTLKYLGKECLVTTVNYTNSDEGKRLIIREFVDGQKDVKLIEGYASKYTKKIPFKTFDNLETQTAYKKHLQSQTLKK
tara:strand:- start:125 stop:376 length:252 start_codon:yes stop_codon:yes gene_type:complete